MFYKAVPFKLSSSVKGHVNNAWKLTEEKVRKSRVKKKQVIMGVAHYDVIFPSNN